MYRVEKSLNLPEIDREMAQKWAEEQTFDRSIAQRSEENPFVFFEGPPSANGLPGIHHVMGRTVKDLFCRYQTLNGRRVDRKGGWDTHGLPVELQVEKELGITKEDIGQKISVDDYNRACRETVLRYKDVWDDVTRRMGYWVDLESPYMTFNNNYIESCWWLVQQLYNKKTATGESYLYKGFTIQPFSPAAGTGLSSHELNLPGTYKDVTDTSIVAMFKLRQAENAAFLFDSAEEDIFVLAWTTTPWTLPSNVALTVGPNIDYCKVRTFNPYTGQKVSVILAQSRLEAYFPKENDALPFADFKLGDKKVPFNVVQRNIKGSALAGLRYEQLMSYITTPELEEKAFKVILGDFVTTEDGTGVVHTAPYFGADDFKVCKAAGIPYIGLPNDKNPDLPLPLVDRTGRFVAEITPYAGRFVKPEYYSAEEQAASDFKPTDVLIAIQLKEQGKAFRVERYKHTYPHCWRTDKPILYYPLDSWFVRASASKERMAELNKTIRWKPANTGAGRFGVWLENLQDWNLSRSRYWGVPLPIWRTKDATEEICIGSLAELKARMNETQRADFESLAADLHRPYIDSIVLESDSGQPMYRELDLIDVWFDSGAMPYAQWHYPFENKDKIDAGKAFPADFIAEGVDQTRGWFYTLHALSVMLFDSVAYKAVVANGLVLDSKGEKMSKSKGNAVDPFETIAKYGADATRWYLIGNASPWDNLKFDADGILAVRNKYFGTLFNTYNFFAIYANVDGFVMDEQNVLPYHKRSELDQWIISKLYSTVAQYRAAMDDYEPTKATRCLEDFLDGQLSNWYVRLSRRRFWKGELNDDKLSAYQTLFECLMVLNQLSASLAPFFADWLYGNLTAPLKEKAKLNQTPLQHDSVHLTDLTPLQPQLILPELEQRMAYAQRICSLVLSLRKQEKLRVRLPLQQILIPVLDPQFQAQVEAVEELILAETNVKQIVFMNDSHGMITKKAKANFKTLGAKMGPNMKEAGIFIGQMTHQEIEALQQAGEQAYVFGGQNYTLTLDDLLVSTEDLAGFKSASEGNLTVALDIAITPKLAAEGLARDLVNRIQTMRKEADLQVTDRINIQLAENAALRSMLLQHGDYICEETLTDLLTMEEGLEGTLISLNDEVTAVVQIAVSQ